VVDYGLDSLFERIVAQLAATNTEFFRRVGRHLAIEIFTDETCKTVIQVCRQIGEEENKAPGSSVIVRQRLRAHHDAGKITRELLQESLELLDDADEDCDAYDTEEILKELIPVLKRHAQKEALNTAIDSFSKRTDMEHVSALLENALRIGSDDRKLGTKLSSKVIAQINKLRNAKKLPTGIFELDAALAGGLDRGSLALFVGPTGAGKSMSLSHVASDAITNQQNVAYATLELGEEYVHARIISNLTNLDWESIISSERMMREAEQRLQGLEEKNLLGFCTVRYFTPNATTVDDIRRWVAEEEKAYSKKIDVVCIDYAALLSAPQHNKWEQLTEIAEKMRGVAADKKCWVWSAAQVKSSAHDKKNKKITSDQAAGSMGLSRTADLVITLNPRDEGETIMFRIDKNRYGRGGEDIGPLPHDFAKGRVAPVFREGWPF